tara:strand:+ start:106 stop:633 length:528 start_codon:yes stop_codon:yes gene_type:complete
MILSCNSCGKKFVVPDNAITEAGRLVQCSACGNKWKQFPINQDQKINKKEPERKIAKKTSLKTTKINKPVKFKKKKATKKRAIELYSPDYLIKKHGIRLKDTPINKTVSQNKKTNIGFGFYNYLLTYSVIFIIILRTIYFTQDYIIEIFPIFEIYINYLFESLNNMKDIINNFLF